MGGNLGNFHYSDARDFLSKIRLTLNHDDLIMTGVDLKKDPLRILNAYNDKHGITKAFNLNLLERINRELDGNFDLSLFYHYPIYDPLTGEVKSFLVSKKAHTVYIDKCNLAIDFRKGEPIYTEVSKKYDIRELEQMGEEAGLSPVNHFFDTNKDFVVTLWKESQKEK
jgi:uncharacterized SAM-dependent methyltransferase